MSTITKEFTKEQLQQIEAAAKEVMWPVVWSEKKAREHFSEKITPKVVLELARIALASLEAEPVGYMNRFTGRVFTLEEQPGADTDAQVYVPLYTAPPAPVSVPAAMEMDDDFDSAFEHGKAVGWNAYRAAMLQGVDRPQNEPQNIPENIPATQFKPVADLYGLTSPTGGETSFTFDAVEARDFIDGGWSCQEYVELERFQEAITNHTEDKLAMVDHSGDSNNMVEPVTTANKLPFDQWLSQQTGTIDVECGCVMTEVFFHWLRVAYEAGNYPVIPDGWVLVPEEPTHEMLEAGDEQFGTYDVYRRMIAAAPQQEA
ncbi:hypothetical protein POV92_11630 [Enterobacter roggenkampii]|uniref:hypothetical protein n=1 Tax=Enterobacter roggenkampii TaxID=1812935 RepID=UPI002FFC33DF